MLDPAINLLKLTVSTGYGSTDTIIVVSSGGSLITSFPLNCTWWNSTDFSDPSDDPNAEIIRVTNVSGNTLTVTRAQEGTSASTKNLAGKTYQLVFGITAKMISDIGNNLQKPWCNVNVSGTINGSNVTFTISPIPFDGNSLQLSLARQSQIQGIDYTLSGGTITYITPPDASLSGFPHVAIYQ
jgi:hypothetical protein